MADDERVLALAIEIVEQARESLAMSFRFLDVALWHMPIVPRTFDKSFATDGKTLYFDPDNVIGRFRTSPDAIVRDYLHTLLHCVFRQPFETGFPDRESWMLACDIAVELTAWDMCADRFADTYDFELEDLRRALEGPLGAVTPMKVYRELVSYRLGVGGSVFDDVPREVTARWFGDLVRRDSHAAWARGRHHNIFERGSFADGEKGALRESTGIADLLEVEGDEEPGDSTQVPADSGLDQDDDRSTSADPRDSAHSLNTRSHLEAADSADDEAEEAWEDIYRQIQMDLRSAAMQESDAPGMLAANVELAARKPVDFRAFLRSFASPEEDLCINDEEFDYIFYTFGFDHYGNMPLIDPLEYREQHRVREFVIAIDTSASCKGELVQMFATRTVEMLKATAEFGQEVNIHLVQCDAHVHDVRVITSMGEVERIGSSVEIKGLGGTDFRPVFSYVDDLVERGEFENLRGLLYFTDGKGTYPEYVPAYDTAFVFLEEEGIPVQVPPWAMKVVLDESGIRTL